MITRADIHALIDDLDERELELAKLALEEIRGEAFDVTDAEERELLEREGECERGDKVNARAFLAELRREGRSDSHR